MRNYLEEAFKIVHGETMMLPERQHLVAVVEQLESYIAKEQMNDRAYDKYVDDRMHEQGLVH